MASILEALQNANHNIQSGNQLSALFAKSQLNNAVTLMEKGYDKYTEIEPLLERYGDVENVPDIDDNDEMNQDD